MHFRQNTNIYHATSMLVILYFSFICSSHAGSIISEENLNEAKILFSGPTEEDYYKTDEMLVSATGSLKPVFLAPSVASVITKEEIEAMGATTLDEVLETVPGLHVAPSYSIGPLTTNYSFRGITTSLTPQTLLLINGIPIRKLFNGARDYRFILPVSTISRVEIVRGPGSAIHGADAFAGTINVITKDGQEINGVQTGVRAGSFNSYDAWLQYGDNIDGWDLIASFESYINDTDDSRVIEADALGTSSPNTPGVISDDRKHYNFHFGLRKNEWTASVTGLKMWDTGVGTGAAPILDPTSQHASERYIADLLYENADFHPDWEINLRTNYSYLNDDNNYVIFPAGSTLPIGSDGNISFSNPVGNTTFTDGFIGNPDEVNKTISLEATAFYEGLAQHKIRISTGFQQMKFEAAESKNFGPGILNGTQTSVGGQLTDVTGTDFVYGPNQTRRLQFISVQDEWALSRNWELTAGVRYDNYSDFGSTTNPRAALVWQTRFNLSSKLLYGRAFRAPSILELSAQNNPIVLGNPNLNPEVIDTVELAFDYRPLIDLHLNANFFVYEIDGLIEFVPDDVNASSSTAQNARNQKGHGAEFEISWAVNNKLQIQGNSAWYKAVDKKTNALVPHSPRAQIYGNIHYKFFPNWSIDAQSFWIGYRARASGDTRSINDYHLTNLTLRKKDVIKNVDLAIAVRNVFDKEIQEPSDGKIPNDFPMNSRGAWVEIRAKF
ncbi:MAG: TonB-dependent receptor [Gammaproteobacteria bacterium]|nr:TonB-dependent receptor [Gammaproteobacteria bacterium]